MNRDGSKGAGVLMDRRRRSGDDSPRRASCGYWRKQTRVGSRVRGGRVTRGSVFSHLAEWRRARRAGSMEHTERFRAG